MMIRALEKKILGKMGAIKNGTLTPKDSGIGVLLNRLKPLDEVLYLELLNKYKTILTNINK
jgi:hypothetical protein